jgi:hypothetical protein
MEEKTARLEDTVEDAKVDHFGTVTELDASTKALVRKVDYRISEWHDVQGQMNATDSQCRSCGRCIS